MEIFNSNSIVILISVIIILSYLFNLLSKKTSIPSVLLLILTGIIIKQGMDFFEVKAFNFFPALEVLGIIGLIMIVLEAVLDLELSRKKWHIIWKSFSVALLGLLGAAFACAFVIHFFIDTTALTALLYGIPLSILSSAIIIPSIANLMPEKKEFLIYESTFSDILGIMFFYFILGMIESDGAGNEFAGFAWNLSLSIVLSIVLSYVLVFVFQNIKTQVKMFLLIAILLLLYSIGKLFHLSSLLIILVFGLVMNNHKVFFRWFLKRWLNEDALMQTLDDFKVVTMESSFVVRTFFFVIFGVTISLGSLLNVNVILISGLILLLLYFVRFLTLKLIVRKDIIPQLYLAPRGLITILLFFAIPENLRSPDFNAGILLFIILVSSIVMTISLIKDSRKEPFDDLFPETGEENAGENAAFEETDPGADNFSETQE